ncbi:MAG: nucleotidyltransferase domain-containing protein [Waddliaceae bacterium]|jgi:uncharacterized protein|nr:nucleotidyltransferase domain-containing protein [Waddliaceae bacterium]MBT3579555.1 nucleotidyltransferase domain-containing protein [Waddliaceae bacterium]MBT4444598.1 nucleotidyltransferase domain-containing protein [Waddliaceae bacterium]MBT6928762.1 nucleotidyltransferase domain-containing protein [Waddliaceae bacterium]MBT7263879.1 nucleotidyltransferase domain-containing protein [Waddliaceae bacterium]
MKFGLDDNTVEQIHAIFTRYPKIERVIIYGSRAKGNFKKGSDIDLTIQGKGLTLAVLNKIELELDDLYLPYTFDLSIYAQISDPDLIEHIDTIGLDFYKV